MKENDQNRIEDYLYGRMTQKESDSFEAELKEDNILAEALDLERMEQNSLRLLSQNQLRAEMANWKAEKESIKEPEAKIVDFSRRRLLYRLSAAASVLLLIGLPIWWTSQNYSNQALINGSLGIQRSFSDRSNIPADNPLLPVLDLAKDGNYSEALTQLEGLNGTDYEGEAQLLTGEIHTEQKDFSAATAVYSGLIKNNDDLVVQQKAEWLLSNVYLISSQEGEARILLKKIADDRSHLKQAEAEKLLKKLDSFWRKISI